MSLRPRHVRRRLRRLEDERRVVTGLQLVAMGWWPVAGRRWPSWREMGYEVCRNMDAVRRQRALTVAEPLRSV